LNGLKIRNGKFYSDQYQGEFVTFNDSVGQLKGLKIINPWNTWIGKDRYEIGLRRNENIEKYFEGRFPNSSYRLLTVNDLDKFDTDSLKIMRNEIFARYSYKFLEGNDMYLYFQQQEWYRARYKNVDTFLTDIELKNIELIKNIEKTK